MPRLNPRQRPVRFWRAGPVVVLILAGLLLHGGLRGETPARLAEARLDALPRARVPERGQRVLVFAPHPDDETLGVGGLIDRAQRRGAEVRVVFLTCGDGFPLCAAARYHRWPGRAAMRRLAGDRRQEARRALLCLGLPPERAVFLGYPDRGLATMWLDRWTEARPYRSRFTGQASVPPGDCLRPGAPYCGLSVLTDIEAVLRRFRPDFVYYPDPMDDHPDHWAGHCFVRLALERAAAAGGPSPVARTYLIHRGRWPLPLREQPDAPLLPPAPLTDLDFSWEAVPLDPAAVAAKRAALAAYPSQQAVSSGFLSAFVRANELLAHWPEARCSPGFGALFGKAVPVAQPGPVPPHTQLLPDSVRDRWGRARCGRVDFTFLSLEATEGGAWLRAGLREAVAAWPVYHLYWKPVDGEPHRIVTRRFRLAGYRPWPSEARFSVRGNEISLLIPAQQLAGVRRLMIAADAWSGPVLLDRTPWRVVEYNAGGGR